MSNITNLLPTVKIAGANVSRLIIGGNPFSGNSHVNAALDAEMNDYFTAENIKKTLRDCAANGVNTMQLRSDRHIIRVIRELRNEGVELNWIAQSCPEILYESNIMNAAANDPIAIYHHGGAADNLFKEKNYGELKRRLAVIRATGKPVGLCSHMPELIYYSEEQGWDVDFYMTCVYNLSLQPKLSSAITGVANENERFEDEDKPLMYKAIRAAKKPCLAFKILGATRNCATPQTVEAAFREAFDNIKPTDAVVVGMFPKYSDQVKANADIVRKLLV